MVSYNDVQNAYLRIKGAINRTPVLTCQTINCMTGADVFFKCENFQKVGAFKFRGAFNALSLLSPEDRARGVITHSSGNHAQALALASALLGIKATIVMPKNSPQVKINATRGTYKADVVLCESTVHARHETTERLIAEHGFTLIHPYDNDNIIAGAGTAALELLEEIPLLNAVIAPVGGGGLLSGTSIACKGVNSNIQVFAGEPHRADDASRSFLSGNVEHNVNPNTIADGLRTDLCPRTLEIIRSNVSRIITVEDSEILAAMHLVWERMKIIIEPSAAVPLAAVFKEPNLFLGLKVGIIVSGGNVDVGSFFAQLKTD